MKRCICFILSVLMVLTMALPAFAKGVTMSVSEYDKEKTIGVDVSGGKTTFWSPYDPNNGKLCFSDVDLTGIKSIRVIATQVDSLAKKGNGEVLRIYLDDPVGGECIGYINIMSDVLEKNEYGGNIKATEGKHDIYLCQTYNETGTYLTVYDVILSENEWVRDSVSPVPDEKILDFGNDTWTAVDNVGRKLADFEEVGGVKAGDHKVCMFYWDWHIGTTAVPKIISEVVGKYPEAKDDYYHSEWQNAGCYWDEPIYGYYDSFDYWVYRKQAELMSAAGIDAIFFDYTNYQNCYAFPMTTLLDAFHDAREAGVNTPKVSAYLQMGWDAENRFNSLKAMYYNYHAYDDYKDLWFMLEGKPMLIQVRSNEIYWAVREGDKAEREMADFLLDFYTIRGHGDRAKGPKTPDEKSWLWLENYPQYEWGLTEDGRIECMGLGMAINESTVFGSAGTGIFSDPYCKGKSYTEAFGEDYSEGAFHQGYFFKEQASRVLASDPAHVFVDGWNEWNTARSHNYGGQSNAFIDLYDSENSRDFEPTKGENKDDYYMLLTDFIRKYKGVRPAPVASTEVTIDIKGDASQWDSVEPEFMNYDGSYERDADGYGISEETGERHHYKTEVINNIIRSKVARDGENFYFFVKTTEDIKTDHENAMILYINTDRNRATGWEGYDFALNLSGMGVLSKFATNAFEAETVGNVDFAVSGNAMQVKIPRSLIGETEKAELEFKWTDNVAGGELMNFYAEGSSAPVGRFNYLYTEIPQTALSTDERNKLFDTTILKAGSQKMLVDGAKMNVYDADIRVTAYEANGTLYVPMTAMEEFMGYGETKITYDYLLNMLYIKTHELTNREITDFQWINTVLGSNEAFVDGKQTSLSAPTAVNNGIIYIPVSILSECFGWSVNPIGDGVYVLSQREAEVEAAKAVLHHFN